MQSDRAVLTRMASIVRTKAMADILASAGQNAMPVDQQLRFENFLMQLSGERPRKDPLPMPPEAHRGC